MRIIKLEAENVKRLRAVEITPEGNLVVISGRNEQGKTSVLDAIWFALGGGDALKGTPKPIRDGESTARVTLDLGDLIVERKWTSDDKSYLTVETRDGARHKSPQAMLDDLVGSLSFDPLAFTQMKAAEQRQTLEALIGFDPTELDEARAIAYEKRTDINRGVRDLEGSLAEFADAPKDLPAVEISVSDIMAENDTAVVQARKNEALRAGLYEMREESQVRFETMRRMEDEHKKAQREIASLEIEVAALVDPDISALRQRAEDAEAINLTIRAEKKRTGLAIDLDVLRKASDTLTAQIQEIDADKAAALQEAEMPIEGLAIEETSVTYRGIPLGQCSGAERLRVSLAMAMALNPDLRVIRIMDGSLLDADNLKMIAELAATEDYQVWMERVDDSGAGNVVIEDGMVQEVAHQSVMADAPDGNEEADPAKEISAPEDEVRI